MTTDIETVIIGAGQAGLTTGYHLQRRGRPFLIVDGSARVGDNWRQHWDTLRLFTPNKYNALPGLTFPGNDWDFPGKDDLAEYLAAFAAHHELPVQLATRVSSVERHGDRYDVHVDGDVITADNVVVATGTFGRTPAVPDFAGELDPSILQLHSSEYRRPDQLREGPVLVVGASHSGTDIAYELAATHSTTLCGRDCGQIPFRIEGRPGEAHGGNLAGRLLLPVVVFLARHVITRWTPIGRKVMPHIRFGGGPMVRIKREDLAARGVERITSRVAGVRDGRPLLDDGRVLDVANVVWCTGFRQVFDWIHVPVFREDGYPDGRRGVVPDAPGLFFCGLCFQFAIASMVLPGVSRDADYVAKKIASRSRRTAATDTGVSAQIA